MYSVRLILFFLGMRVLITDSYARHIGRSLVRAFALLHHDARLVFDDRGFYLFGYQALAYSPFRNGARALLARHERYTGAKLKTAVRDFKPDAIVVVGGDYVNGSDIALVRKRYAIPVINWVAHDPTLSEFFDPLRIENLAEYDHICIADELWEPCVYFFGKPFTYVPLGGDESAYRPLNLKKDIDILFAGDFFPSSPHTAGGIVHARVLERLLEKGYNVQAFVHHRSAILPFVPPLKKLAIIRGAHTPQALNALYNRAKIVLNLFPLDFKHDAPEALFNVALSDSFQLAEYKKNILSLFGGAVEQFDSLQSLEEKISGYLPNEAARAHQAKAAYAVARGRHTYAHRAQDILEIIARYQRR